MYKKYLSTLFLLCTIAIFFSSCKKLNVAPPNILTDETILGTSDGVTSYMARLYSEMPIEDFKWSPTNGYNGGYNIYHAPAAMTGEALSRDMRVPTENSNSVNWNWLYSVIRDCNYFIQNFPSHASAFTSTQAQNWLGEAYFVRSTCYYALVRRFGGVPLVTSVINYPVTTTDSVAVNGLARSSEADTWNLIGSDLDSAYNKLPTTNQVSRANKSTAAAYKARAMLYAGCIAKYNTNVSPANLYTTGQICGFPAGTDPKPYFQASYDAAKLVISGSAGKTYSLYMKDWVAGNLTAQFRNMVDMFFDASSPENIFVRQYGSYQTSGHDYDCYNIPDPIKGPSGWGSETLPTLDFVEMFDGFPHYQSGPYAGKIQTLDSNGNYVLYDKPTDLFANAEPRLKAYVITPMDVLKGTTIEIRAGIYKPSSGSTGLIKPSQIPGAGEGNLAKYDISNSASSVIFVGTGPGVTGAGNTNKYYTLPNGQQMLASGNYGIYPTGGGGWYSANAFMGFGLRKYLDENLPQAQVLQKYSTQSWIEIRYAEVLLTAAEAIMELNSLGQPANVSEALGYVNSIQNRAGATITSSNSFDLNTVRKEWRKEFAFENKTWFNLLRWRLLDKEMNHTVYRQLTPFYVAASGKYFFDTKPFEEMSRFNGGYTWNPINYYQPIPTSELSTNKRMIQNVGY
ncbi:MAG: RagB/SusD family nutrient uptake outer membrane protein [Flavisolibacter sp.]